MEARGGVLLEVMLALALLVAVAIVVLSTLDRSAEGLKRAHDQLTGANLARSAMARIEAGIDNAQSLNGPVPAWTGTDNIDEVDVGTGEFEDAPPPSTGWELQIRTEPTSNADLTLVTVRAVRRTPGAQEKIIASYSLRQLVRLGTRDASNGGGS